MRFFITLSFCGTAYCGWQVQPDAPSVQERLEQALATLLRRPVGVTGAGRTDAGVHAAMMVAHFDAQADELPRSPRPEQTPMEYLVYRLNAILPHDIAINDIRLVPDDMHARFSATARTYYYYVHTHKSPFLCDRSWRLVAVPDFELMNRAAAMLLDVSDFTSFARLHSDAKTNICHVTRAQWVQLSPTEWRFEITADRFLRNMVRAVVGTLMDVGRGRLTLDGFRRVIADKNRCAAGDSVPAWGLFLQEVKYSPSPDPSPVREGSSGGERKALLEGNLSPSLTGEGLGEGQLCG